MHAQFVTLDQLCLPRNRHSPSFLRYLHLPPSGPGDLGDQVLLLVPSVPRFLVLHAFLHCERPVCVPSAAQWCCLAVVLVVRLEGQHQAAAALSVHV